MSTILLLVVSLVIYFVFKKNPFDKSIESSSTIIDYETVDNLKIDLDGKRIFQSRCASCHLISRNATGPALSGVAERYPWEDTAKLFKYIREPESFGKNKYVDSLRQIYGLTHIGFPDLTNEKIKAILRYIDNYMKPVSDIIE